MKRLIFLCACVCTYISLCAAGPFEPEHLTYRVTYKWGLIQKVAGAAELTLTRHPDHYDAVLTARTQPWADRIFMVRDTIKGRMRLDMYPLVYDKSTHEEKDLRHDLLRYEYHGNRAIVTSHRTVYDKKGNVARLDTVMSALLPAIDMVSVYYHVRQLPFDAMQPGTVSRGNIFSGNKIEKLAITYEGDEEITLNGRKRACYRISFKFSSERVKETSKPMKAWIEKTGSRIPVKLEGELPVGKIQVLYND